MELAEQRKKKKEEKAAEKEAKKQKAIEKEASRKFQEQADVGDKKEKKNVVKLKNSNKDDGDIDKNTKNPETPQGQKKLLSLEMAKEYNPSAVEKSWYQWWEAEGLFTADAKSSKPPFVMVEPPPNVTGKLHIGHAETIAIEDCIIRYKRMSGFNTLWVPGMDHAGIATQVVVEKKLMSETGETRHDLGREEFVKRVWEWVKQHGGTIMQQQRHLGASLDFTRKRFTMDERCSKAVVEGFVRLHNKKLIYRANRIVNWDCSLKTAISDIELDSLDIQGRTLLMVPGYEKEVEYGLLTTFAYPLEDELGEILVATTRIETMLGDTAIAVHPDDERYKHLHGKHAFHPFSGRRIPIICDAKLVDPEFGTGAVKITPAHDPNDFEVGKRHNLEFINIFTDDGEINQHGGEKFAGMPRFKARELLTEALKEKGLFRKTEVNEMKIKICSRSNDVVEPMMKPQWYVKCSGMGHEALISVEEDESNRKKLEIIPKEYTDHWKRWLENIHDWCISRQLWWGHRIPAWYAVFEGDKPEDFGLLDDRWVVARNLEEARAVATEKFGQENKYELSQEPDVLDTWFSSGIYPLSVFGWPEDTEDLRAFYPTSLLETGHDILFFWVARMVMLGITLGGDHEDGTGGNLLPFPKVYLHPMIRDAQGRKMSKSLGNVIDPVDVINGITLEGLHEKLLKGNLDKKEIEVAKRGQKKSFPDGIMECGADALRFALIDYTGQSESISLDIKRVESYRCWCNRLWNAEKFAIRTLGDGYVPPSGAINPVELPFICQWILSVLNKTIHQTVSSMESYKLSDAAKALYRWWQYQLCDIFIEGIKPYFVDHDPKFAAEREFAKHTLWLCLDIGLRLLHPFMPFITEELWQRLHLHAAPSSIMVSEYPSMVDCWKNEKVVNEMDYPVMFVVTSLRSLAKGSRQRRQGCVLSHVKQERQLISTHSVIISQLANVSPLEIMDEKGAAPTEPTEWAVSETINFSFYRKLQDHHE